MDNLENDFSPDHNQPAKRRGRPLGSKNRRRKRSRRYHAAKVKVGAEEPCCSNVFEFFRKSGNEKQRGLNNSAEVFEVIEPAGINFASDKQDTQGQHNAPTKLRPDSRRVQQITDGILDHIIIDLKPLSTIDETGFIRMLEVIVPEYPKPVRAYITHRMHKRFEDVQSRLAKLLKLADYICVSVDLWSANSRAFLEATAHFLTPNFEIRTVAVDTVELAGSHNSENLTRVLSGVFSELDLISGERESLMSKAVCVVTDNDDVVYNLRENMPNVQYQLPCIAHTVSLAVTEGLKQPKCAQLIKKVRAIAWFVKRSVKLSYLLRQEDTDGGPDVKLLRDVSSRWTNVLDLFERVLQVQDTLTSTMSKSDDKSLREKALTSSDWYELEKVTAYLKPIMTLMTSLSSEAKSAIQSLYPAIYNFRSLLLKTEPTDPEICREFLSAAYQDFDRRYRSDSLQKLLRIACFLDPRVRDLGFISDELERANQFELAKADVIAEICVLPAPIERSSSEPSSDSAMQSISMTPEDFVCDTTSLCTETQTKTEAANSEIARYLADVGQEKLPLDFWRENQLRYEMLSRLARKHLCVCASSVLCERLFSEVGFVCSNRRASLSPESVRYLTFLHKNQDLL